MSDEVQQAWMQLALDEAQKAAAEGEVPVGAIVVHEGKVIGVGRNARERSQDPTTHAEIIAIRQAARALGSWRLIDCELYVTLEPCPMCAGALVNARISTVVWGCDDPKAGATRTLYQIGNDDRLNHRFRAIGGVLENECSALLSTFFARIREAQRLR